MRLPWVQVTQEAFAKARMLAGLLGISRREAMGVLVDLWAWALDLGPSDQPPTGELVHGRATALLASVLEWPADRADQLAQALEDVGVIEVFGAGLRVRGMDRYRRTWEKNHRRKTPVTGTVSAGWVETGGKPAPQTQTQTQTQTQKEEEKQPSFFAASGQTVANSPVPPKSEVRATGKGVAQPEANNPRAPARKREGGEQEPLRDRMEAAWLKQHGAAYAWSFADDTAMRRLLQLGDPEAILARWERALAWQGFPSCGSLKALAQFWNEYAKAQPSKTAEKPVDTSSWVPAKAVKT